MNRKTIFSYFMWFLYAAAVSGSLFRISGEYSRRLGYLGATELVMGSLWLLLSGLLVFGVNKYIRNDKRNKKEKMQLSLVSESAIAVFLLSIGIFLRLYGMEGGGEYAAYYEMAMVAEGQVIPTVVHGAVHLYLQLLHLIFLVFGNKFLAGICLQIVLQIVAVAFLYLAVRKLSGVFPALVMLGFAMTGTGMVEEALMLSPRMMLLAIYAVAFFIVITAIKTKKSVMYDVFAGLLTAVVCYLDVIGISLVLFAVVALVLRKSHFESQWIAKGVAYLFSATLGFVLLMWVDSFASSVRLSRIIRAWCQVFVPDGIVMPWEMELYPITWDVLFLVLALSLGIFSFWRGWKDRQSLWVMMALLFVLLSATGIATTEIGTWVYLYITASVLAATGTAGIFVRETKPYKVSAKQEDLQMDNKKGKSEKEASGNVKLKKESSEGITSENASPVKYIENPLPLPKKHVKKVLDFDRQLQKGMEDYDLKVADDDDFDI